MSATTGLSWYAEVALVIFIGVFIGVTINLFFSDRKNAALALLPLEDDSQPLPQHVNRTRQP
jgi:cbb3-type cytochrome oxidase subunit 3